MYIYIYTYISISISISISIHIHIVCVYSGASHATRACAPAKKNKKQARLEQLWLQISPNEQTRSKLANPVEHPVKLGLRINRRTQSVKVRVTLTL